MQAAGATEELLKGESSFKSPPKHQYHHYKDFFGP